MTRQTGPKVSVLVLTFDHEKYIEQALEGALRQKTRFDVEIVVAEDCSRDRTAALVKEVAERYPGRVRILPRQHNLGICRNFMDAYQACTGDYVAILEGDDIWHHPHKLQKMADVLDRRKSCSFVFHNVRLLFEDGREQEGCCPPHLKSRLSLRDFVAHNYVPNCSGIMFRHRLVPSFPDWFQRLAYYDWPLHILHLAHGPAVYISEPLSTYRIHGASAWHGADNSYRLEKLLEIFRALDEHLDFRYDTTLRLNSNYWKLHTENADLRQRLQELDGQQVTVLHQENAALRQQVQQLDLQQVQVLNSRSFKLAHQLAGMKRWLTGLVRRPAA